MRVSTWRFLPPLPAPPCCLVPPCPPAAPELRVVMFLQGIRCACGCRPSCCLFGVDVVVVHHAVLFIVGFESLPVQGRCCRNLDLTLLCSFYCRRCYCNVLDSSLCRTARWGIQDPSFRIMFVYPVWKRYGWKYTDLCISITVSVSNCPCFLDSPRMCRWG